MTPVGNGWAVSVDQAVIRTYEWRGTGGLHPDLPILLMRPPGTNGGVLVDLRAGHLYPVPHGRVAVPSPNLQFLLLKDWVGDVPRAVQELKPNPRAFRLPRGDWARWQGSFLYVGADRGPVVVDPAEGVMWQLPRYALIQSQVAGQVCYEHRRGGSEVVCFTPGGPTPPATVLARTRHDPVAGIAWLEPDPTNRRLAIAYKSSPTERSGGVAHASSGPSPPPIMLADTLLFYEAETARSIQVPVPTGKRLAGATWSPDGRYLGLHSQAPKSGDGPGQPEVWVVEVSTGRLLTPGRDALPWSPGPTQAGKPTQPPQVNAGWRIKEQTQEPDLWRVLFEPSGSP